MHKKSIPFSWSFCAKDVNERNGLFLMKWFSRKKKEPKMPLPELYTEEEMAVIAAHIAKHFGAFDNVFHVIMSHDIHVAIVLIPPTEERNYYTLVTMGMGAHRMNIPSQMAPYKLERAELMICLPPDWKVPRADLEIIGGDDEDSENNPDHPNHENWYWPLRWLKILARLPIENNTWLGYGHTVPNGESFAENTELCCIVLAPPAQFGPEAQICEMPDGSRVIFYQMLPLYADEMNYKLENDADVLLEKFEQHPAGKDMLVLDIKRPSVLEAASE